MYLDVNAGLHGEGLILFTASHELVHMIREGSPEQFKALADFLVENYAKKGVDVNKLVLKEMSRSTNLNYDAAYEEVIAQSCESFLRDIHLSDKAEQLYKTDKGLATKIKDILSRIVNAVKKWYGVAKPQSVEAHYVSEMKDALEEAYDRYIAGIRAASQNLRNMEKASDDSGVKYQKRSSDSDAIKIQLADNTSRLNETEVVADVTTPSKFEGKRQAKEWAVNYLKSSGYLVDRQNFGNIEFNEKLINKAFNYLNSDEEYAAFACLPRVLKKGIIISGHENHKNRGFETVTIGAAVKINGQRMNMAVVVKIEKGDNKYRVHRVLTPVGSKVSFNEKTEPTPSGATKKAVAPTIGSVSDNNVSQSTDKVKRQSRDSDYLSAVERGDMQTAQRMVDEAAKAAGKARRL